MTKQIFFAVLLVIGMIPPGTASELVTFKGSGQETLKGKLSKPEGKETFPGLILLPGFNFMDKYYDVWSERLAGWGYVTLQLNGVGPRGQSSLSAPPSQRAQDVCYAKGYLSGLPFVDPKRIGVIGWSQRGSSTLAALCTTFLPGQPEDPLRAVVTFYPYCFRSLTGLEFPLLILIGELDNLSPVATCLERMPQKKTRHEVILKVYPGANHCFDVEGVNREYMGHRLQYNPAAAADSIIQVKAFLTKHMK
jgi:dienelactone hydrolase